MTFGELTAAVVSAMARSDVPAYVYALAQAEINGSLRIREMDLTAGLAVTAGVVYVDLPSGFIQMRHAYIGTDGLQSFQGGFSDGFSSGFAVTVRGPVSMFNRLEETSGFNITTDFQASGTPTHFTIQSGAMRLNPVPDTDYTIVVHYCHAPKIMVAPTETNPVIDKFPSLYFHASMRQAAIWAQNTEQAQIHEAAYRGELQRIMKADRVARNSGPLVSRRG